VNEERKFRNILTSANAVEFGKIYDIPYDKRSRNLCFEGEEVDISMSLGMIAVAGIGEIHAGTHNHSKALKKC
jgi:hypothetical protein